MIVNPDVRGYIKPKITRKYTEKPKNKNNMHKTKRILK